MTLTYSLVTNTYEAKSILKKNNLFSLWGPKPMQKAKKTKKNCQKMCVFFAKNAVFLKNRNRKQGTHMSSRMLGIYQKNIYPATGVTYCGFLEILQSLFSKMVKNWK